MASEFQNISDILQRCETAEVRDFITSMRERIADLREKNSDLNDKLKFLEEKLEDNTKFEFDGVFYWEVSDTSKKFPFCQQCRDNSQKNIRLQFTHSDWWECKTCKNNFNASGKR